LQHSRVVDVQDAVGDLGPLIVEGDEVPGDGERRRKEWGGRVCYEEMLKRCASCE
jgi:hypothetical protein